MAHAIPRPLSSRGEVRRDALLVALGAAAGAVDVISYLGLGNIFTANMSGNLIFFGLAVGGGAGSQALHSVAAFAGFLVGAGVGARLRGKLGVGAQSRGLAAALALAALAELGLSLGWIASGGHPGSTAVYLLIVASALAMGAQSAAVRSLSDVSTTYLTGTMTALVVDQVEGQESKPSLVRRVSVILAFVAAAAIAALLISHARVTAPLVPLALICMVVVATWRRPWS
jgi:uncharacterized membrane protein YoaK (UPF0700 family)